MRAAREPLKHNVVKKTESKLIFDNKGRRRRGIGMFDIDRHCHALARRS
jgi:hypothetical protein